MSNAVVVPTFHMTIRLGCGKIARMVRSSIRTPGSPARLLMASDLERVRWVN
jgi:hypothetical protein